jgi:outer membrane protein
MTPAPRPGVPPPPASPSDSTLSMADSTTRLTDTLDFVPVATVTLSDAIDRALRVSPVSAQAAADVRVSRATERVAAGEYLPDLTVTSSVFHAGTPSLGASAPGVSIDQLGTGSTSGAGAAAPGTATLGQTGQSGRSGPAASALTLPAAGEQTTTPTGVGTVAAGGPFYTAFATATAGWDIFTAGRRPNDVSWARARRRAANAMQVGQQFVVVSNTKIAFFNLLRAEDLAAVARSQRGRAQEDVRQAQRRLDVGTEIRADILQLELNLNQARQTLLQATIARRSAAYELGRQAGLTGPVEAQRPPDLDPTPLALPDTAVVSLAMRAAPSLVAARDSALAARAAVAASRTEYVPVVRLGASYTVANTGVLVGAVRPGWAFDVGTEFPIFNGFVREEAIERAEAGAIVARTIQRDAERETRAQVENQLGALGLAGEQVRLAQQATVIAREDYRVQLARYGVGASTVLDLATALQNLALAEQGFVNARYDYQLARANLQTLVGQDI